jgi:multidrug resistance efflux pump
MPPPASSFQNFISAEDLENANTALNTATTNLEAAKAVVGVAQATSIMPNGSSRRRKLKRRLTAG